MLGIGLALGVGSGRLVDTGSGWALVNPSQTLAGALATFSPIGLSPTAWLRGDLGVTLNGSAVSGLADQSGNGHNATQATGALQPGYTASDAGYNGRPTLQATGTQRLVMASLTLNQPFTVIMVGHCNSGVTAGLFGGPGNEPAGVANGGTNAAMYAGSQINSSTSIATKSVMSFEFGSGTGNIYVNSSASPVKTGSIGALNLSSAFVVMWENLIGVGMTGSMAELIILPNIPSTGNRSLLFQYASSLYGGSWS